MYPDIRVNSKWVITTDPMGNWMPRIDRGGTREVVDHGQKKIVPNWSDAIGYYSSLETALVAVAKREAMDRMPQGEIALETALQAIRDAYADISAAIREAIPDRV